MNALPPEAETLVARIEALLNQAEALLAHGGSDEAAYALRETGRRYLPDTLNVYLDVPPARRDATAATMLVEQLRLLERATAQRLAALSESAETALAANGAFLTERFGAADSLPAAPEHIDLANVPPTTLVRRAFERMEAETGGQTAALLDVAARRLSEIFPALVQVHRSGFLGRGPVDALALDVPRDTDMLRYSLARSAYGGIDATVTRFLRGIKNRTVTADIGDWTRGLIEDLGAYAEHERGAREALTRLFQEQA